jgi:hypothetical protein
MRLTTTCNDRDDSALSDLHPVVVATRALLNTLGPRLCAPCDVREKDAATDVFGGAVVDLHALALLLSHCPAFVWATHVHLAMPIARTKSCKSASARRVRSGWSTVHDLLAPLPSRMIQLDTLVLRCVVASDSIGDAFPALAQCRFAALCSTSRV